MEIEHTVCGGCLNQREPLVVNAYNKTAVCYLCYAILNKIQAFQKQCVKAKQLLKDYITSSTQTWTDFSTIHHEEITKSITMGCLNNSNTLCLDILPNRSGGEEFVSKITSYCSITKNNTANYCEGMVEIQNKSKHNAREANIGKSTKGNKQTTRKIKKYNKIKKLSQKGALELVDVPQANDYPQDDDADDIHEIEQNQESVNYTNNAMETNQSDLKNNKKISIQNDFHSMFLCRFNLTKEEQIEEMEKKRTSEEFILSPFKCSKCCIGFKFQYSLDNHMTKHSEGSGSIVCEICTQRFSSKTKQREHIKAHHSQVLQCVVCGKRLKERKRLRDHWESHLGVLHTCDICKKGFKTKSSLIHHIAIHNNKFPCPHCHITLRSGPTYKKHLLLHSTVRPHVCQSCPRIFATREWLELHTQRAHAPTTEQFYCVECDYRFKSNREYKKHLTAKKHTHPSLLIHSCSRCSRRYATQEELSRHTLALHERVLTYSCPDCPARFATTRGLYGHKRRVHLGYIAPKKYSCSYCNKAFRDKYYLINHVRIHTGDSTHKCSLCMSTFTHTSALAHHVKQVHKDGISDNI